VTNEADCSVKFGANVPLLPTVERPSLRRVAGAFLDAVAVTVMPSLFPSPRSSSRPSSGRAVRLLLAVSVLAALVTLPRVRAATPPAVAAGGSAAAVAAPALSAKNDKNPTCEAIMQRLSGSLAGTPGNTDKRGTVLVDVDKAGVTMACSHSDAVAIPVPASGKTR